MLLTIFYYILISVTCLATGYYTHLLLQRALPRTAGSGFRKNAMVYALWGLVAMTLTAQTAALFFPLNQGFWVAWSVMLIVVSLIRPGAFTGFYAEMKYALRPDGFRIAGCCAALLLVSSLGAGPLMMDDTESYHIQAIKWIQEYGTVPGLANLHERYGFNSSWFSFAALCIPSRTAFNFYTLANGTISFWFCLYLLNKAFGQAFSGKAVSSPAYAFAGFAVLATALGCWPMIRGNAATANYDFITACTLVVLLFELCRPGLDTAWQQYLPEMIAWPVFLFTVRIINFPLLLISLYGCICLFRQKRMPLLATMLLFSIMLVVPFLIRNVMLSGYLFFPVYQVDWFRVDWKADVSRTKKLVDYIKYFNRVNTGYMPVSESRKLVFPGWMYQWFRYLFSYDKLVLLAGLSGYLSCIARYRQFRQLAGAVQVLVVAMTAQFLSWFIVAPDPRFVYGPLLAGIFLIACFWPVRKANGIFTKLLRPAAYLVIAGILALCLLKILRQGYGAPVLRPALVPEPALKLVRMGSIEFRIPEKLPGNWNVRCYGTCLPCLYEIQPGLKARGRTMAQGFKIER